MCSSLATIKSVMDCEFQIEGATTENARRCIVEVFTRGTKSLPTEGERSVYDCQPRSIQGDRIPASKLGHCPQSCGLGATPRFWGGVGR